MVQPWLELAELDNPSDPYGEVAINSATFVLWSLSGRKYNGVRTSTEQYVCPEYDLPAGCSWVDESYFVTPGGYNGYVVSSVLSSNHQRYGVRIRLRHQPVRKILSVSVGGTVLPSANYYYIRNSSDLVIQDEACASLCDGPEVTYVHGTLPPDIGRFAAIELANEYVKFYNQDDSCSLPARVTSISRQGLDIQVYDPADFLDKGRIGLPLADAFIAATNPSRALKPAKIFSPDLPRGYTKR